MAGRPLRIAFAAYRGNMRCGGQGVYLWFLARELARLGHEIHVYVGPPYPDPMPFAERVVPLPNDLYWARWFMGDWGSLLGRPGALRVFEPLRFFELFWSWFGFLPEPSAFSLRAQAAIRSDLRRGPRFDLVHDVQCLGFGLLALRLAGIPVVSTVHHPLSVDRRTSFARAQTLSEAIGTMTFYPIGMQSFVARRLDAIFTSSAASAGEIERDFGVERARLRMVANGVDTELFCPDPAVTRDAGEILCVGRASDPNKGVATLVDALALLPPRVRLTLVDDAAGENGALKRARALGIADRVDLVGRVPTDRLIELYRRAALCIVPSRYEGFGLPAAEALACGTPVVATHAGALPEVVGDCGALVPADDAAALAAGIRSLLDAPEARAAMAERGRERIESLYAWPRIAAATAAVYEELVSSRAAAAARGRPHSSTTSASDGSVRATASSA
jgi:glycosyltransferase involved in cell wall biosynthesis